MTCGEGGSTRGTLGQSAGTSSPPPVIHLSLSLSASQFLNNLHVCLRRLEELSEEQPLLEAKMGECGSLSNLVPPSSPSTPVSLHYWRLWLLPVSLRLPRSPHSPPVSADRFGPV